MNNQDILAALAAARTFKPEPKRNEHVAQTVREPTSFVSMYDELDRMDFNTFNTPVQSK